MILTLTLVSLVSLFVGYRLRSYVWHATHKNPTTTISEFRATGSDYQYINPLLGCSTSEKKENSNYQDLRALVADYIDAEKKKGDASRISVYYDTRDGRWFGNNIEERFFPASLMKVPLMIAYFKKAESDPLILKNTYTRTDREDKNEKENFRSQQTIEYGKSYTVDELIQYMTKYSDNNATALLVENIDTDILNEIFTDLGIQIPADVGSTLADYMTVKEYANFFRILYNATYLNRDMSEKALSYLAASDFIAGIKGGVAHTIPVAHKFGERAYGVNDGAGKELHDCGIVYEPDAPYMLCVMTSGTDYSKLSGIIQDITKIVETKKALQ